MTRRLLTCTLAAAVAAAPAQAAERVVTRAGYDESATPARYDRVRTVEVGPTTARHVLVLEPGTSAGAGSLLPDAHDLVKALPGWQVWIVERRENLLEDHSVLDEATSAQQIFDYYLGWLGQPERAGRYQPPTEAETAFARRWGMRVAVEDLRRVVRVARSGGRTVVLGGHSLGATIATAYATWDFRGRAGARDLAGLVLIDGGSRTPATTPAEARAQLEDLASGSPFLDLAGTGLPWSGGVFAAVGSSAALMEPDARAVLQAWPLLPAALKPPVPATNRAAFGYALDTRTGPDNLRLIQAHIGHLADAGDPRGWVNDGPATVERAARALRGIPGADGSAWFHPRRLTIEAGAVNGGAPAPAQKELGLRSTRKAKLPIYAIETSLGKGRVLAAARALSRRAGRPPTTLVDRSANDAHCDPLFDVAARNAFLKTVAPFLRARRGP